MGFPYYASFICESYYSEVVGHGFRVVDHNHDQSI